MVTWRVCVKIFWHIPPKRPHWCIPCQASVKVCAFPCPRQCWQWPDSMFLKSVCLKIMTPVGLHIPHDWLLGRLAICMYFSVNCLLLSWAHFSVELFIFSLLICRSCFFGTDSNSLLNLFHIFLLISSLSPLFLAVYYHKGIKKFHVIKKKNGDDLSPRCQES